MLLVHLEDPSPRARYVVAHVLGAMLAAEWAFAQGTEEFRSAAGPKLAYGGGATGGDIHHIPASGGLALAGAPPAVAWINGMPCVERAGDQHDVFASIFRLLSLVDEVGRTGRDRHGRVPAEDLFVVKAGLSDAPWADRWALHLRGELEARWPGACGPGRAYKQVLTVDLDNVLRYAGRPLLRAVGASGKDLLKGHLGKVRERWHVRAGQRDPFLAAIDLVEEQLPLVEAAILFLLLRGGGKQDHAVPPAHWPAAVRARFTSLPKGLRMGLHPSYHARDNYRRWADEAAQVQKLGLPVRESRHHFLRWDVPETLRTAEKLGFVEEHSLGFSDRAGFRASTCTPFPWYDLERERQTNLVLHPFAAMDSALIGQGLGPEAVAQAMDAVSGTVRAVGGTFISVWHDRYLSGHREFAPWPDVFRRVIRHARA